MITPYRHQQNLIKESIRELEDGKVIYDVTMTLCNLSCSGRGDIALYHPHSKLNSFPIAGWCGGEYSGQVPRQRQGLRYCVLCQEQ